jgi:hypothetical protein
MIVDIDTLEGAKNALIWLYVLSTIGVIIGVYFEGERFSEHTKLLGWRLLLWSLAAETLFGVLIFAADGRISRIQRDEIIALETRITPRVLTSEQYNVIQTLRGKVTAVSVMASPDVEPAMFSAQLQAALVDAGVAVTPMPARPENRFVGTQLCLSDEDPKSNPLWKVLSDVGMGPGGCSVKAPKDIPLIVVGERPPFFPSGTPKSFRMRSYPGFQGPLP